MIKTILVPVSGTPSDDAVCETALALARPLGAHLAFHHIRLSMAEAARHTPHMAYCVANGMPDALEFLDRQIAMLATSAQSHVAEFCRENGLLLSPATDGGPLTASWSEEAREPEENLLSRVHHADLTVLGRRRHTDYMPQDLIETLLLEGGRPLVIAADGAPPAEIGTIVVGWQDRPEAARALTASMPLLKIARRVIVTEILRKPAGRPVLGPLARHLERHGIQAEIREVLEPFRPAEKVLPGLAAEWRADMLVIGSYGKSRLREALFGGVTRTVLDGAEIPVFLLH